MTERFVKRVFNAEDGTRTLAFYKVPSIIDKMNPFAKEQMYISFNINELEDLRIEMDDLKFAVMVTQAIESAVGFRLTPEEIEFALEDI